MNQSCEKSRYNALVVDFHYPLQDMVDALGSKSDDHVFTPHELFVLSLSMLHYRYQIKEAVEALMIEISTYHRIDWNFKTIVFMEQSVRQYLHHLHSQFIFYGLYDQTGELTHTLGGWVDEFTPYFIPRYAVPHHAGMVDDHRGLTELIYRVKQPSSDLPTSKALLIRNVDRWPWPDNSEDDAIPWGKSS